MAPNPRVAKAFRAMRELGIAEEKVKPVLKNLLKLFEKNWDLIEEENYRLLADSIFESEEAEAVEQSKKNMITEAAEQNKKIRNTEQEGGFEEETQVHDETERPLKRLRLRYQENQIPPSASNPSPELGGSLLKKPKEEAADDLPDSCSKQRSQDKIEPPQTNIESAGTEPHSVSPEPLIRNKGKQPITSQSSSVKERSEPSQPDSDGIQKFSPQRSEAGTISSPLRLKDKGKEILCPPVALREKRPITERSSNPLRLKEPRVEPGIILLPKQKRPDSHALIKPKDEPFTDVVPHFEVPIAVIHPGNSSNGNGTVEEPNLPESLECQPVDGGEKSDDGPASSDATKTNSELAIVEESAAILAIASSPYGEVKISLSCHSALERPDFRRPNLDKVVTLVEEKCLTSYKVLDPTFSVKKLMKDICECFLEITTDPNDESQEAVDVTPPINLLKKSSVQDALAVRGTPFCPSNGSSDVPDDAIVALPLSPRPPSSFNGGTDDCMQHDENTTENGFAANDNERNFHEDTNSLSLMVVQHPQPSLDDLMSLQDINDLAKGQERVIISLVNEINSDRPPSFHYIPQNVVFQNAHVSFSLARIGDDHCCSDCLDDCLSSSTPCACAHETGGVFAYTTDGLVKEDFLEECISKNRDPQKNCMFHCKECPLERLKNEGSLEPCKGHLVRKFIKECWWKCGCSKYCGNRVVQRGINCNLQVFMTAEGKGWGLRTLVDLPKGAFVCEYVGEILTNAEFYERVSKSPSDEEHAYPVLLDADWGSKVVLEDEKALCLDGTCFGNVARFVNHRCFDSNLVQIPVEVETPEHHYYHLAFFTTRKVEAKEELTWDYGIDFDDLDNPIKAFCCLCGSKFCRNIKRSNRGSRGAIRR